MEAETILKRTIEGLSSKYTKEGGIWIGMCNFANYPVKNIDQGFSFDLAGSYYGIDNPEYWGGVYYDEQRDLFFYVGQADLDDFSKGMLAFPIQDDLLNLLTPVLRSLIKKASFSKTRLFVEFKEKPGFLSLPENDITV